MLMEKLFCWFSIKKIIMHPCACKQLYKSLSLENKGTWLLMQEDIIILEHLAVT